MTTLVGSAKGTNTATAPAHAIGDILVVCATRNASVTPPGVGSGFTSLGTKVQGTYSSVIGFKIATSTSDATGTWTNATETIVQVYRPTSGRTTGIGASASGGGTSSPAVYPALTLTGVGTSSWVVFFGGAKGASTTIDNVPSGATLRQDEIGTGELAGFDTNGPVSSRSSSNVTYTGTATDWITWAIEVLDIGVTHNQSVTPVCSSTMALGKAIAKLLAVVSSSLTSRDAAPPHAEAWNTTPINSTATFSNGNKTFVSTGANAQIISNYGHGTSSGKYYFEISVGPGAVTSDLIFIGDASFFTGVLWAASGSVSGAMSGSATYDAWNSGDTVAVAIDQVSNNIWFQNITQGGFWNANATNDPASDVGGFAVTAPPDQAYILVVDHTIGGSFTLNTGSSAFTGTVPAGFSPWFSNSIANIINLAISCVGNSSLLRTCGKTLNVASSGFSVAAKQVGKIASISSGGLIALAKSAVLTRLAASTSIIAVSASRAFNQIVAIASSSAIAVSRAVTRTVSVASASAVTLLKALSKVTTLAASGLMSVKRSATRSISIASTSAVTAIKAVSRSVLLACVSSVASIKNKTAQLSVAISGSSAVSFVRSIARHVAVASISTVTTAKATAKAISVASASAISAIKGIAKTISLGSIISVIVAAIRSGADTFLVTVSATASGSILLSKQVGRSVAVAASGAISFTKAVQRSIAIASTSTLTAIKAIAKTIALSVLGSVASSVARTAIVAVTLSVIGAVVLTRQAGKKLAVTSTGAVFLVKGIKRAVAVASSASLLAAKNIARNISVSSIGAVIVAAIKSGADQFFVTVTAVSSGSVSLLKQAGKQVAIVSNGTLTIAKAVKRTITESCSGAVSSIKSTTNTVAANCVGFVVSASTKARIVVIVVASSGAVLIRRAASLAFAVAAEGAVSTSKAVARNIFVAGTTAILSGKAIAKSIVASCVGVASALAHTGHFVYEVTVAIAASTLARWLVRLVKKSGPESQPRSGQNPANARAQSDPATGRSGESAAKPRTGRHDANPQSSGWPAAPRGV